MIAEAQGLQLLIDQTPAMLWRSNQEGRCVFLNKALRDFWGIDERELANFEWSSTLLPEDKGKVFGPFSEAMEAVAPFTCEARYRRTDGTVRLLRTRATPYFSDDGGFLGMIGVNEDITDLRDLQAELAKKNEELEESLRHSSAVTKRFELASQISGLAMSEHNEDLRYTWAHNLPGEPIGLTPEEYVGGEVGAKLQSVLTNVAATEEPSSFELDFLLDGRRHWWEIQVQRTNFDNNQSRLLASALDVTARKFNESKLEVLSRELGHRVKNFYALTQALLIQSARASRVDPSFVQNLTERISALSRAQDALFESSDDYISVQSIVSSHLGHLNRINAAGDGAKVLGKSVTYLGLAFHELGTNALKYGALSRDDGYVNLTWNQDTKGTVHVTWEEQSSCSAVPSSKEGFGTALLTRIFAASTNGLAKREFTPEGFRWTASIPTAPEIALDFEGD